jgi:hypothetical protein
MRYSLHKAQSQPYFSHFPTDPPHLCRAPDPHARFCELSLFAQPWPINDFSPANLTS